MGTPADSNAFIHHLWDELADFDAAHANESLDYLLSSLCRLVGAQNASWFGAVRMGDIGADPLCGWRPCCVHYLYPSAPLDHVTKEHIDDMERGRVDVTMVRQVAMAGTFRTNRLIDLAPSGWFGSDHYHRTYVAIGYRDAIYAGIPVTEDSECYFGIRRDNDHPPFSPEERDLVARALRGLKWFCRQQMLSRGLTVAGLPLTVTEREVLGALLTGLTEKQIASARNQSPHTNHEYVKNIYRKFGVRNRAALMALWLGQQSP